MTLPKAKLGIHFHNEVPIEVMVITDDWKVLATVSIKELRRAAVAVDEAEVRANHKREPMTGGKKCMPT